MAMKKQAMQMLIIHFARGRVLKYPTSDVSLSFWRHDLHKDLHGWKSS